MQLTDFDLLYGVGEGPTSAVVSSTEEACGAENIDFDSLSDITPSVRPRYDITSFDEAAESLFADLALSNDGGFLVDTPLLLAIDRISDPSVVPTDFDGRTPDGLPTYQFTSLVEGGTLDSGEQTGPRSVAFLNPQKVPFTFEASRAGTTESRAVTWSVCRPRKRWSAWSMSTRRRRRTRTRIRSLTGAGRRPEWVDGRSPDRVDSLDTDDRRRWVHSMGARSKTDGGEWISRNSASTSAKTYPIGRP